MGGEEPSVDVFGSCESNQHRLEKVLVRAGYWHIHIHMGTTSAGKLAKEEGV